MLREIMHLRAVFIYLLRIFEELNADFGMAARHFANATVHPFLDEIAIVGTEEFLGSQKHALRESAGIG